MDQVQQIVRLVVSRLPMDDRERQALLKGLLTTSGARPVELTVVVRSEVRPWRMPPTGDFLYGEWLRGEFEASRLPQPHPMPDLAVLVTMMLAGNHPLVGPPAAQVLYPVPQVDLVAACLAGIPGLLHDLDSDTRNIVLTLARIWTTLATGEIRSKDAAADWALNQLPPGCRPVLAYARELYLSSRYSEETWSDELKAPLRSYLDTEPVVISLTRGAFGPSGWQDLRAKRRTAMPASSLTRDQVLTLLAEAPRRIAAATSDAQRDELLALLESLHAKAWSRRARVTGAGAPLQRSVLDYAQRLAAHERPHVEQIAAAVHTSWFL
jgi:Domain of unknown function (DUF4111)